MKYLIFVSILFLTVSCFNKPLKKIENSNSNEYEVHLLFNADGCNVYKFFDNGPKYFTNCKGSTQWSERRGKVTHNEGISGGK